MSGPVMLLPSALFARGTWIVWLVAVGTTSPCQPLTSEMCPSALARRRAVAAIDDRIHQHAAGFRAVDRLHQREGADVLDLAARVARRELDVGDEGVLRIGGIELAVELAAEPLVGRRGFWGAGGGASTRSTFTISMRVTLPR